MLAWIFHLSYCYSYSKSTTCTTIQIQTGRARLFQAAIGAEKDFTASQRDQFVCAVVKKGGAGTVSLDIVSKQPASIEPHPSWSWTRVCLSANIALTHHWLLSLCRTVFCQIRPQVERKEALKWIQLGLFHQPEQSSCANVRIAKHETLYIDWKF